MTRRKAATYTLTAVAAALIADGCSQHRLRPTAPAPVLMESSETKPVLIETTEAKPESQP